MASWSVFRLLGKNLLELLEFFSVERPVGLGHAVQQENVFEMVVFMLDDPGEKTVAFEALPLELFVLINDFHLFRSFDLCIDPWKTEASLLSLFSPSIPFHLRVYKDALVLFVAGMVGHKKPNAPRNLRCRKTDAVMLAHQLEHLAYPFRKVFELVPVNISGRYEESRVGVGYDFH